MGIVLGITGGIATGKTTVTDMFRELGAETISADDVAHEVLAPGAPVIDELVERFGHSIIKPDGSIDRSALAEIVFKNPEDLAALNDITHPPIIEIIKARIREFRSRAGKCDVLAVEIPLLIECKLMGLVDKVIVVAAEQETQLIRLTTRGFSYDEALRRIAAQLPTSEKLHYADEVVRTDVSLEDTRQQVERVWKLAQSCDE
ncbi:MAG: dephospho-CoA kinase [Armatimonadota bacterium]